MTKWSNPECETHILIKLLLSKTYIFIVFLMWVSPLVHDAIHIIHWCNCLLGKYEWDDIALQTLNSIFEPWRSEAEGAVSESRKIPTIICTIYESAGKKHFVSLKLGGQSGDRTRDPRLSKQAVITTAPEPPPHGVLMMPDRPKRQ